MIVMGGVKRIVAVDDSNIVLKMLQNVLDKEQYDLHPFSTGTRALEYLVQKDKIPDLIILDIEMPEMNGYDVLERIKKMEHLENVPVIFLTANGEKKQVLKAVTGGVKDYVVKPIDKDVLMKKLNTLFNDQHTDAAKNNVADAVENSVTDAAENSVADAVENGVADAAGEGVADAAENSMTDAAENSVTEAAENSVVDEMEDFVAEILENIFEDK